MSRKVATTMQINRRSILLMAWVYARMAAVKSGCSPRQHIAAALRQAWAEEKAEAARKAVKAARWERERFAAAAVSVVVEADAEARRLAGRTVPYYRGFREIRTGRVQGGRW